MTPISTKELGATFTPSPPNTPPSDINPGVATQQANCQWLQDNFPQTPEAIIANYGLPENTIITFIYEICPLTANAFALKATAAVILAVPPNGCIDSWAGITDYIGDVGAPVPDGAGGWRVFQGAVSAPEMTYRVRGCTIP